MTGHQAAYDLTDTVAVVTGAASGIGAASARLLAEAGAYVICADRDRDGAERTVKDLDGRGEVLVLDVSDERAVDEAADAVASQRGRLDIWCNVAGIIETRPIAEMDDAAFSRIFDVNFLGTLHGCRAALRVMTAGGRGGSIINLASAAIDTPAAGIAAYAISKAAVAQLTKTLALEAGPANIRVNAIAPGFVISAMTSRHFTRPDGSIDEAARDQVVTVNSAMSPLGVVGEPDDIAHAVVYLAAPAAKFVTGQIMRPNGGVAMPW
ncbi:MAG: SDR family NAD(P)-dependent oxidoreductase [Streptosporangiaceae bacterium]